MSKLYDAGLSEVIRERLTQLEQKPALEPKVPARRVIEQFKEAARQAMAKGYTLAEIRQIAQEAGLEVSVSTLKTYLRSRKAKKKVPEGQRKVAAKLPGVKPGPEEAVAAAPQDPTPVPSHAGFNEDN